MKISFDNALGIHPKALEVRDRRTELIASNLANADTPDYKARDLDFRAILQGASNEGKSKQLPLKTTHPSHLTPKPPTPPTDALYRVPAQPSLDGNTVESEMEHVRFGENALQYQASLNFIGGDFQGLRSALRGD